MKLLEGKKLAGKMLRELKNKIAKAKIKPGLAVILIGNNKASELYVSLKAKAAGEIGMDFWLLEFNAKDTQKDILQAIRELNKDKNIHGIIVQLPLPKKFNTQKIINTINPRKDADGFSAKGGWPVFPQAAVRLIEVSGKKVNGKKGIVVANSDRFGKVMVATLKSKKIKTQYFLAKNLKNNLTDLKDADVIVTAVGKAGIIKGSMVKKGVIVIDGGITKKGKKVLGDVDRKSLKNFSGYVSPVPGGVGPVTVVCLLNNVYLLSRMGV